MVSIIAAPDDFQQSALNSAVSRKNNASFSAAKLSCTITACKSIQPPHHSPSHTDSLNFNIASLSGWPETNMDTMNSACCAPKLKFFTQGLWIEGEAEAQFDHAMTLEGAVAARAMPDLHPGKGIPIGSALITKGLFYPHLAGNDLGCGTSCSLLAGAKRLNPDQLAKLKWLKNQIDSTDLESHLRLHAEAWSKLGLEPTRNFGSIGGGNHFVEISLCEEVYDQTCGIEPGMATVLVHTGSRHLGEAVARSWTDNFKAGPARAGSEEAAEWMGAHDACVSWAALNRQALARSIGETLGCPVERLSDTAHNEIESLSIESLASCGLPSDGSDYFLHRKGASKADAGLCLLPGSRGDYSYLLRPKDVGKSALSLAHGAGRKWKRSDCESRLSRFGPKDFEKTKLGSRVLCADKELLYEEAPQAYKDCASVLAALVEHGLASPAAKLRPLLTLKI
jgi:release factor H-coupled RctB family protein